ncbi:hypothetical protein [Bartonella schoenbuchensis]
MERVGCVGGGIGCEGVAFVGGYKLVGIADEISVRGKGIGRCMV